MNERWFLLRRLLKYSSPLWRMFESKSLYKMDQQKYYPVFIIGSPRSGTTLLYQLLSNYYKFLYVDNLINLSHEAPRFGFWLSQLIFKDKPHNSFKSEFGNTVESGLHAPNQTPIFWLKYRDMVADPIDDIDKFPSDIINSIRSNTYAVLNRYKKPIVMKGAVVGNNLKLFSYIFPNAKYIFLKRNPLYTAQSLYQSLKHFKDFDSAWMIHLKPKQKILENEANIYKKIALYIYYIYQNVKSELKNISPENKIEIDYESLSGSTAIQLENIHDSLKLGLSKRTEAIIPGITIKNTQRLIDEDFNNLKSEIYSLQWDNIGIKL